MVVGPAAGGVLAERGGAQTLHGQITIGTLILQDCTVGLLFALLPVLGGTNGVGEGVVRAFVPASFGASAHTIEFGDLRATRTLKLRRKGNDHVPWLIRRAGAPPPLSLGFSVWLGCSFIVRSQRLVIV